MVAYITSGNSYMLLYVTPTMYVIVEKSTNP